MLNLVIIFFTFLYSIPLASLTDQRPDLLIVGNDTILLRSYPLEELGFETRPFSYGKYSFPGIDCIRGYQAVWKVVNDKLFLAELVKADGSGEKIDIVQYFIVNEYNPIVIDGLIFADWFTKDLTAYPRQLKFLGCVWKNQKLRKQKSWIRFENGIMISSRYK